MLSGRASRLPFYSRRPPETLFSHPGDERRNDVNTGLQYFSILTGYNEDFLLVGIDDFDGLPDDDDEEKQEQQPQRAERQCPLQDECIHVSFRTNRTISVGFITPFKQLGIG